MGKNIIGSNLIMTKNHKEICKILVLGSMRLIGVTIQRSDTGAVETLHYREDRLRAFNLLAWDIELLKAMEKRLSYSIAHPDETRMPGISGVAAFGLGTIFTDIPSKFPIDDLLKFLQGQDRFCQSFSEAEKRLELMGSRYPAIDLAGNDREQEKSVVETRQCKCGREMEKVFQMCGLGGRTEWRCPAMRWWNHWRHTLPSTISIP